jgi:hypothetical protein
MVMDSNSAPPRRQTTIDRGRGKTAGGGYATASATGSSWPVQAAFFFDFATWAAMASISPGDRQS